MENQTYTGDLQNTEFKQSENKIEKKNDVNKKSPEIKITNVFKVMHNKNCTKEFQIGRKWFRFDPYEVKDMTDEEINHPDFKSQKNYFSIKES
jgi:hypothetical protein